MFLYIVLFFLLDKNKIYQSAHETFVYETWLLA